MDNLIFRYFPCPGPLHRFDPRFKLPLFAFLCYSLLRADYPGLVAATSILLVALIVSRIPVKNLMVDFMRFCPLLLLFFVALYLGARSGDGLKEAVVSTTRFGLIILAGNLFIQTTRLGDLGTAVRWYLHPLPFIKGGRIATMITLSLSMIPLFFRELDESRQALKSRGLSPAGKPIRWTTMLVRPLMVRIFLTAGETAEAMEARCYSDLRHGKILKARAADWLITGVCVPVLIAGCIV